MPAHLAFRRCRPVVYGHSFMSPACSELWPSCRFAQSWRPCHEWAVHAWPPARRCCPVRQTPVLLHSWPMLSARRLLAECRCTGGTTKRCYLCSGGRCRPESGDQPIISPSSRCCRPALEGRACPCSGVVLGRQAGRTEEQWVLWTGRRAVSRHSAAVAVVGKLNLLGAGGMIKATWPQFPASRPAGILVLHLLIRPMHVGQL